jgi:hypothetical protein
VAEEYKHKLWFTQCEECIAENIVGATGTNEVPRVGVQSQKRKGPHIEHSPPVHTVK